MKIDKDRQEINEGLEHIFSAGQEALLKLHHKKMAKMSALREEQEKKAATDILKQIKEL